MRPLILVLSFVVFSIFVSAQCPTARYPVLRHPFKIKAVAAVDSGKGREGDYVEFQTMEPIYSQGGNVLFAKGTPVFGVVTLRKTRHFPLVNGRIELELEPLMTWNGDRVGIGIARYAGTREPIGSNHNLNRACKEQRDGCVAGRTNPAVSGVVTSVAGAGTSALGYVADKTVKFIAVSSFFALAKDGAELLNGTHAEIMQGEIFNMYISYDTSVCAPPKEGK